MQRAYSELVQEGQAARPPPLGVMVEVPSAIYQIADLATRVDFFSIGTNDLTQYLLAIDRTNARVARHYDSLHPAVLRAINHAACQARDLSKPLSVCGEMAGDPASAILLVGMGIKALSMASPSLPRVKRAIRAFSRCFAEELLAAALRVDDVTEVHRLLEGTFEQAGLSSPPGPIANPHCPGQRVEVHIKHCMESKCMVAAKSLGRQLRDRICINARDRFFPARSI